MIHPLMVISFVLTCLAVLLGVNNPQPTQVTALLSGYGNAIIPVTMQIQNLQNLIWAILLPFLILCTLGPWISLISTLKSQNLPLLRNLGSLLVLILLSLGISLSNMREAGKALLSNRIWEFKRTPKYADLQNKQDWRKRRYQISIDPLWVTEFFFTMAGLLAIGSAIRHTNFSVLMILVPFTFSYGFVLWLSIQQSRKAKAW
jgi:hypothetical protein